MRQFTAVQILNVTSFILCSRMGDIYELLSYMFAKDLCRHQLPIARDRCAPKLLQLYPQFAELGEKAKAVPKDNFFVGIQLVLDEFTAQYGNVFDVPTLTEAESSVFLDALIEEKFRQGKVLQIDPSDPNAVDRIKLEITFGQ